MKVWSIFIAFCVAAGTAFAGQDPAANALLDALAPLGKDPAAMAKVRAALAASEASGAPKNSTDQKAALISSDAKYWAFRPVVRPTAPATGDPSWVLNPIDAFVLAKLEAAGLKPSPPADKRTLIRRVYLDVLGLPPTPEEVDAFAADAAPDAYEKLVDHVLASPHYGERWARHWLDVVRYAETMGFEMNKPRRNAWHYRDYVIDALNADMPYTQFVTEQLAGDATGAIVATGFLVAGPMDEVKSPDIVLTKNQRDQELHDMTTSTAASFLGLTLGCAKCHDHKFDPISQHDYYAMRAVFSGVEHGERELPDPNREQRMKQLDDVRAELAALEGRMIRFAATDPPGGPRRPVNTVQNVERFAPVEARFIRFSIRKTSDIEPCIDELEVFASGDTPVNVASAKAGAKATASSEFPDNVKHKTAHLNDGLYGNDHSWIPTEREGSWAQIELKGPATIDTVSWGRDRDGNFRDRLAVDYTIAVSSDGSTWTTVATSEGRVPFNANEKAQPVFSLETLSADDAAAYKQLQERQRELRAQVRDLSNGPRTYAPSFDALPAPTYLLQRGDAMQDRGLVAPGTPEHVGTPCAMDAAEPEQQRRVRLAAWICSNDNPLTARVIVNRIWQHHYGKGIVDTPSDFGAMGARPTHPKLLDWLACALEDSGWRLKSLHRLILMSNTYRQSSAPNAAGLEKDAESRLMWRYPPRRLDMEPMRDSILYVCGQLDLTKGGPGFDVFEPDDSYVHIFVAKTEFTRAEKRRMIYQWKPRVEQDITFGIFDCPDASQAMPKRNTSTSPLQALSLLNSPFMMQQTACFAERVQQEAGGECASQVRRAYALALERPPSPEEESGATALVQQYGLGALCRALLNSSEFVYLN